VSSRTLNEGGAARLELDCAMKAALLAAALLLAACSRTDEAAAPNAGAAPTITEASTADGCSVRLSTRPAHPFFAEFSRQLSVECNGAVTALELQLDPGGLGRVELVRTVEGQLAVTDAFQSATFRIADSTLIERGLHDGKLDRYATPCVTSRVFARAPGEYLGAFDYCDHRWQFLRPS